MRHLLTCVFLVALVFGASPTATHAKAGGDLFKKLDTIGQSVEQKQWDKAKTETRTLRNLYHKKEWKIQMIGDEREYEGIGEGLDALNAAIKVKDKVQATIELANIHALLESVYSL